MQPACDGALSPRPRFCVWESSASGLGRWKRVVARGIGFLGGADQAASRAAQVRRVERWDGGMALL